MVKEFKVAWLGLHILTYTRSDLEALQLNPKEGNIGTLLAQKFKMVDALQEKVSALEQKITDFSRIQNEYALFKSAAQFLAGLDDPGKVVMQQLHDIDGDWDLLQRQMKLDEADVAGGLDVYQATAQRLKEYDTSLRAQGGTRNLLDYYQQIYLRA